MTMRTIDTSIASSVTVVVGITQSNIEESRIPHDFPAAIPLDELPYWSAEWRKWELAAREALTSGEYVDFDSDDPTDVVKWLMSDDDE